jgi:hypothetical protein
MTAYRKLLLLPVSLLGFILSFAQQNENKLERLLMDFSWRFAFGHPYDTEKDFGSGYVLDKIIFVSAKYYCHSCHTNF